MATLDNIALDRAEYVDLLRKIMAHNEKLQNNPANVEKLVRISRSQTRHNMAYHIVASSYDAPPPLTPQRTRRRKKSAAVQRHH